jgi:hypothetical protein
VREIGEVRRRARGSRCRSAQRCRPALRPFRPKEPPARCGSKSTRFASIGRDLSVLSRAVLRAHPFRPVALRKRASRPASFGAERTAQPVRSFWYLGRLHRTRSRCSAALRAARHHPSSCCAA